MGPPRGRPRILADRVLDGEKILGILRRMSSRPDLL